MFSRKSNIYLLLFILLISVFILLLAKNDFFSEKDPEINRVELSSEKLDEIISQAVLSRATGYMDGEFVTEGHIILGKEEKGNNVKVYTVASLGVYGFENGIFTTVSGSGSIPTVMEFEANIQGEWELKEYKEPMDGGGYGDSIKKMFPKKIYEEIFSGNQDYYEKLKAQQKEQAQVYLDSIGREAEIQPGHVEKTLSNINVEASNKLFAEHTKYDEFLNNCPYWIGTRERIEEGQRFIYETKQEKTIEGKDMMIYSKTNEKGEVIEVRKYLIEGSEPVLVE